MDENEAYPQFNSWFRFQRYAEDNGFDSLRFCAFLPAGPMMGRWLDAYMGLIKFDGLEGFVTVDQLDEIAPDALCIVQPSTN
jgi:hypothetical protein